MKNNKIILSIISISLALPMIVSAAWWNPFTWGDWIRSLFTKKSVIEVKVEQPIATTTSTTKNNVTAPYSDSGIVLVSPNGGEVFRVGDKVDIFFEILDKTIKNGTITLDWVDDQGKVNKACGGPSVGRMIYSTSTKSSFTWEIPKYMIPGQYKIKVGIGYPNNDYTGYLGAVDISDRMFKISHLPSFIEDKKPIITSIPSPKYDKNYSDNGFEVKIIGLNFDENSVVYRLDGSKIKSVLNSFSKSTNDKSISFSMPYDGPCINYSFKGGEEVIIQIGNGANLSDPATFIVPERPSLG